MCFSGPSVTNTPIPPVATPSDPGVVAALNNERLRQSAQQGRASTILTQTTSATQQQQTFTPKTVLGQ